MWYKRSEQPLRQAAWFLGNTFAGIVGGLLAYAIGHIDNFPAWKVCINPPLTIFHLDLIVFFDVGCVFDIWRFYDSLVYRRLVPTTG
jgi:hypothetical protein